MPHSLTQGCRVETTLHPDDSYRTMTTCLYGNLCLQNTMQYINALTHPMRPKNDWNPLFMVPRMVYSPKKTLSRYMVNKLQGK